MEYYSQIYFDENNNIESSKELKRHLEEVYTFIKDKFPQKFRQNLNIIFDYKDEDIDNLIKIIAYCHDFGKFNKKFQEFLKLNPIEKEKFKEKRLKEHSWISSLFTFFIANRFFPNNNELISIFSKSLAFYLIRMHHSNLINFEDEIYFVEDLTLELMYRQLGLIDDETYLYYSSLFNLEPKELKSNFCQFLEEIKDNDTQFIFEDFSDEIENQLYNKNNSFSVYFVINTFYSLLHDADVHSAADILYTPKLIDDYELVKDHIKKIGAIEKEINIERNEIFGKLDNKVKQIDIKKRIYQITAPTGSGKTLASLNFSLQLKKRLKNEKGIDYKIIYSIPFTSIIDQTFDVFNKIILEKKYDSNEIILRHHHLTDMGKGIYLNKKYNILTETEPYIKPELNSIVIESWDFDLIVTTFIQLFESLITNNKERIKKIHNVFHSIILVDECQNIPVKYWDVLRFFFREFSNFFDTYLIFLTATQPLIFSDKPEETPIELLDNHCKYFNNKNRTKMIPILKEKTIEEYFKFIKDKVLTNNYQNVLIVLNTVKDTQDMYRLVKEEIDNGANTFKEYKPIFLSASLIPKTKVVNIDLIKELNKKSEKYIAITTQLIEAGVDINNNIIFRDIAPIENLIQTAGRCNREGDRPTEQVFILKIKRDDQNEISARKIYDDYLLQVSEDLLIKFARNSGEFSENCYLTLFKEYMLQKKVSSNQSLFLKDSLIKLKYYSKDIDEDISSFSILKKNYKRVSCFINLNEDSNKLLSKYNEVKKIKDFRQKTKEWIKYKNDFQLYIVDIPEKIVRIKVDELVGAGGKLPNLIILDKDEWAYYYDLILGYKSDDLILI